MIKTVAILLFFLTVLWIGACTHSSSGQTAKTSAPQAPAGDRDQSRPQPQQTRTKPPTGGKAAPEIATTDQKKTGENTGVHPSAVQDKSAAAASADATAARLEEAREKLRVSEATEQRITAEFEQLKRSGKASAEDIRNYEAYLNSVRGLVAENRKIVARMQAAYDGQSVDKKKATTGGAPKASGGQIPGQETADEVAVLDRQLNASLDEFDGMLLKQMDAIRAESADKMRNLAQEAAEAANRLRKNGVKVDTSADQAENAPPSKPAGKSGSNNNAAGRATASGDQSRQQGQGTAATKDHRAGYADDDIVARQLREAAENETDPELKQKLWKEYEQYKKDQR